MGRLENNLAIVTGGGGGIGSAIAERFASEGADVAVADIYFASAERVANDINTRRLGGVATAYEVDVANPDAVDRMVQQALGGAGEKDLILVNNAAPISVDVIGRDGDPTQIPDDVWHRMFKVIVDGTRNCTSAIVPAMVERGRGSIINIGSGEVSLKDGRYGAYSAAKAAMLDYGDQVAVAYARLNVRVNSILPGLTQTDKVQAMMPQLVQNMIRREQGLPGVCLPKDIAGTAVYFASGDARMVTGQKLTVAGTYYLHAPTWSDMQDLAAKMQSAPGQQPPA